MPPELSYKEDQIVCVLIRSGRYNIPDKWHFGRIAKLRPVKQGTNEEPMAEVFLYGFPENFSPGKDEVRFEHLYPSVTLSREMILLSRLQARMLPKKEDQYSERVIVRVKDLCPAKDSHFLKRLIGR